MASAAGACSVSKLRLVLSMRAVLRGYIVLHVGDGLEQLHST
jgi:hypothetical protein